MIAPFGPAVTESVVTEASGYASILSTRSSPMSDCAYARSRMAFSRTSHSCATLAAASATLFLTAASTNLSHALARATQFHWVDQREISDFLFPSFLQTVTRDRSARRSK